MKRRELWPSDESSINTKEKTNENEENSGNFSNLPGASEILQNNDRGANFLENISRNNSIDKLINDEENRLLEIKIKKREEEKGASSRKEMDPSRSSPWRT